MPRSEFPVKNASPHLITSDTVTSPKPLVSPCTHRTSWKRKIMKRWSDNFKGLYEQKQVRQQLHEQKLIQYYHSRDTFFIVASYVWETCKQSSDVHLLMINHQTNAREFATFKTVKLCWRITRNPLLLKVALLLTAYLLFCLFWFHISLCSLWKWGYVVLLQQGCALCHITHCYYLQQQWNLEMLLFWTINRRLYRTVVLQILHLKVSLQKLLSLCLVPPLICSTHEVLISLLISYLYSPTCPMQCWILYLFSFQPDNGSHATTFPTEQSLEHLGWFYFLC